MVKKNREKARLLPHEKQLLESGHLQDITHKKATSKWLSAPSKIITNDTTRQLCYRHMGDVEFAHLLNTGFLPETQPYQTLTRGQEGREYCESYLRSNKFVDTNPTTVVEFDCPEDLIDDFYRIQSKIEDGTISHGLSDKAGKTIGRFNEAILSGDVSWRIVLVKRRLR